MCAHRAWRKWLVGLSLCCLVGTSGGCISFAANMLRAVYGNNTPAEYEGLIGKKVAIVCATDQGFGQDVSATLLAQYISATLNANVKDIKVIRQEEVESWQSAHGWSESDYYEIGRGVKAERVLAVEVSHLSLKDGATLFRGQADIGVTVYDTSAEGKIVFRKQIPEFSFPKMGGPTISDTTESKFRGLFLTVVAQKVAGLFYPVDATADFALDAISNSF